MMPAKLSGLRWWRIVSTAAVAFVGSMLIIILIVTGYAFMLGFQARGARLLPAWPPDLWDAATFAAVVSAGWVGAFAGRRPN